MKKKEIAKIILKVADKLVSNKRASIGNHWSIDSMFFYLEDDELKCRLIYDNRGGAYILNSILGGWWGAVKDIAKNNYPGKDVEFIIKWKMEGFSEKMLAVIKKQIKFYSTPNWVKSGKLKTFFDEFFALKKILNDDDFNPVRDMKKIRNKLTDAKITSIKVKDSTYKEMQKMDEQGEFLFKMRDELEEIIEFINDRVSRMSFEKLDKWKESIEKLEREAKKPSEKEFVEAIQSKFDWDEFYDKQKEKERKEKEYRKEREEWYKTDEGKKYLKRKNEEQEEVRTNTYGT